MYKRQVGFTQTLGGVSGDEDEDSHARGGATASSDAVVASPQSAALGNVLRFFRKKRLRSAKIGSAESPTSARTPASRTPRSQTPRKGGEAFSIEAMSPAAVSLEEMSPESLMSPEEISLQEMSPGSAIVPLASALAPVLSLIHI